MCHGNDGGEYPEIIFYSEGIRRVASIAPAEELFPDTVWLPRIVVGSVAAK
jgi:hypothetical protein